MPMKNSLQVTLTQLDEIQPAKLPVEKLRELQQAVKDQQEQLVQHATGVQERVASALEQSDPGVIRLARKEAANLRVQNDSLEDLHVKLDTAIHERTLRDAMVKRLGSTRRLQCLEIFIMILIVFILGLLFYDSMVSAEHRPDWLSSDNIFKIDVVCCMIFLGEFIFRLSCAESKKYVWKHHWIDCVTSIPIPGEAQLARFGRVARLARFARLLRLFRFLHFLRVFFMLWRGMDKLQDVIDIKMMKKTIRWAVFVTLMGAFLIYHLEGVLLEGGPDGTETPNSVGSLVLAIWWSFTTVLTGGFGDIHNPTTVSGQVLTAILVITGMVFVGVFTATLTSLFVGEQTEEMERLQDDLTAKIDQIGERLKNLERH